MNGNIKYDFSLENKLDSNNHNEMKRVLIFLTFQTFYLINVYLAEGLSWVAKEEE